ncbi:MAG: CotS family spore coat protein, partial [Clostridiaceae bacterium]|nr:CotS family spore coat protein [Clostridiaceae bacterium]
SGYGKLKRHDLKLLVESLYGLEVKNMQEGDRGILVYTDRGIKRLKKIKSDEAKILFAASAYEHIYNNGFRQISCINRNLNGSYHMRYDKYNYILQDFTKGRVYEIVTGEDAAAVGKALAKLHKAGEQFIPAPGSRARVDWGKWMEKFKANSISLNKFKEIVDLKEKNNAIDKLFIENVDEFLNNMNCSYTLLKENGYLDKVRQAMACNQVTHSEFKKHAILHEGSEGIFITNFEECSYDICEFDIATLFESFSGKNKAELAAEAAEAYSAVKPLDRSSIKIIKAFLLCPKRFYKFAENTYGRRKNCNEIELAQKFHRSIKKEKKKGEIIRFLDSL